MNISVVGAGSWGSAVAWLLGTAGHEVRLWVRDSDLAASINATRHNARYLSDVELPSTVRATAHLEEALEKTEAVILATPSTALPQMAERLAEQLAERLAGPAAEHAAGPAAEQAAGPAAEHAAEHAAGPTVGSRASTSSPTASGSTPVVLLSKGIERDSGQLLLDVLAERLGDPARLAVLSGPNHAEEVARGVPSATVVASASAQTAHFFQELFSTQAFRVYTSADTVGVQLCAAAKNVIAIACGLASGSGMGDNTLALLMTRGLAEIGRLVASGGGEQLTCMGLAGMGDLIATCTSPHSRNRGFGLELAAGGSLESYQQRTHMVVEGALASAAITDLARAHSVELPISEAVRAIVWEGQVVEESLLSLLARSPKPEFY
ncbi:MAG: NAD(P)-dependent glycerol-3-phosphate dehydrogenase [Coriobacteriales bacterium]|nr:NAD(P)-dependent glycerol-3-phosphate dehydrogenase [Coriobacteriales bacterium]